MATKNEEDPLKTLREQVRGLIEENYRSVDDFCLNAADVPKSTVSRLLSGDRTEFRYDTLQRIAEGLGKKLVIKLE